MHPGSVDYIIGADDLHDVRDVHDVHDVDDGENDDRVVVCHNIHIGTDHDRVYMAFCTDCDISYNYCDANIPRVQQFHC